MTDIAELLTEIETNTVTTDDRGRAYLGTDHANSTLKVAILEVEDEN